MSWLSGWLAWCRRCCPSRCAWHGQARLPKLTCHPPKLRTNCANITNNLGIPLLTLLFDPHYSSTLLVSFHLLAGRPGEQPGHHCPLRHQGLHGGAPRLPPNWLRPVCPACGVAKHRTRICANGPEAVQAPSRPPNRRFMLNASTACAAPPLPFICRPCPPAPTSP